MFKVKTPLWNRLKERHLDVCCKVAVDGPDQEALDYKECMRRFYRMKKRRLKCSVWLRDVWMKCTFNLKLPADLCMYIVLINECFNIIMVTLFFELLT